MCLVGPRLGLHILPNAIDFARFAEVFLFVPRNCTQYDLIIFLQNYSVPVTEIHKYNMYLYLNTFQTNTVIENQIILYKINHGIIEVKSYPATLSGF